MLRFYASFFNFAETILVGYKYAAYYYWHSFRYVKPTDDGVTLKTIYSFTRGNNTFVFLKLLANSFTEGLSSIKIYFKLKNICCCNFRL